MTKGVFRKEAVSCRPRTRGVSVERVDSLRTIDSDAWERLTANDSLYVSYPYLRYVETHPDFIPQYLIAENGRGRIVGALPVYSTLGGGSPFYNHFSVFIEPSSTGSNETSEAWFPALLGGTRAGYDNKVIVDPSLDGPDRHKVLGELLRAFDEVAGERQVKSSALMYLDRNALAEIRPWLADDSLVLLTDADARLNIQWEGFEAYLSWLPKRRRYNARREIARFEARGFEVSNGRLSEWYKDAGPLQANLVRKYGATVTSDEMTMHLEEQARVLDDASVVFLCQLDGDLVGFSLAYERGSTLYFRTCGFDYERTGSYAEYFNLVYYLPIRYAIENGFSAIRFGPDSYEAKVLRGAQLEPLWSIVAGPDGRDDADWQRRLFSWNQERYREWHDRLDPMVFGGLTQDNWNPPS